MPKMIFTMCSRTFNPLTWRSVFLSVTVALALLINFSSGAASAEANDFEVVTPETLNPAVRTWTAASGSTVEAKFVRLEGENVILAREDGVEFRIPGSKLSAADIDYVKALIPDGGGLEQVEAARVTEKEDGPVKMQDVPGKLEPKQIPVFTTGPWQGAHAVYEHANFDAVMDTDGTLNIYPKDQGKRIAKPLKLIGRITYRNPYRGTKIIELTSSGDPVMQPKTLTLQATTVDHSKSRQEVDFEVTYSFEANEISAWGRSLGEGTYKHPEMFEVHFSGPKTHQIEPSVEQSERIKILKDYSLVLKGGSGGSRRLDYYTSPKFGGDCKSAELVGPMWKPRKITITGASNKAPIKPWVYPGRLLWEGFQLFVVKPDPRSESESQKMVIRVE